MGWLRRSMAPLAYVPSPEPAKAIKFHLAVPVIMLAA
jgi:hypothetical protein